MATKMLEIRHLHVSAGDRPILHDISLTVGAGETHVLFGPNGSGKSCLLATIMGLAPFVVTSGEILFRGEPLGRLSIDERARLGLGMSFQRPPGLDGVTVARFSEALKAAAVLEREAPALDLGDFAPRDINVGFSGGEIKRWEILKLFLQQPRLCLFDEPESGVDLEHIAAVGNAIDRLLKAAPPGQEPRSALVITHTGLILEHVRADAGHMLVDGRITWSGEPRALFRHIQRNGYSRPAALPQT